MRFVVGDGQNFELNLVRGHRSKKERVEVTGLMIIVSEWCKYRGSFEASLCPMEAKWLLRILAIRDGSCVKPL